MKCGLIQLVRASLTWRISSSRGRQQDLPVLAVDRIPVDIRPLEERVIGAQGLDLGDGVVKGAPIPEADVVEQVLVAGDVDTGLGTGLETQSP